MSSDGTRYLLDELTGTFNRITADEMANQFADLTVTPSRNRVDVRSNPVYHDPRLKYAGYVTETMLEDEYNAQKQRETSTYAPGLELTYPEFDLISFSNPVLKEINRFKNWKGVKLTQDKNDLIQYILLNRKGNRVGDIRINTYDGIGDINWMRSKQKGGGRLLMDAVIQHVREKGLGGVKSGRDLLSAPKTYNMWKHYPDKQLIGRYGTHTNQNMVYKNSPAIEVPTKEAAIEKWNKGEFASFRHGDIYLLKSPSQQVQYWIPYSPSLQNIIIPTMNSMITTNNK